MFKKYLSTLLAIMMFMGGISLPALADAIPEPEAIVECAEPEAPALEAEAPVPEADAAPVAEADSEPDAETAVETTAPEAPEIPDDPAEPEPEPAVAEAVEAEPKPEAPAAEPAALTAEPIAAESVAVADITLGVKQRAPLAVQVLPGNATYALTYTSSKKSVATVSADGVVTAKAVGTAVITVTTENGKKATCKVTVKKAPGSIKLNVSSGKLGVGETYQLQYTLTKNSWGTVAYKSNNEEVATVNAETGLVEAKAAGTATITATTHNGKKATCKVTVLNRPERIELSATELTVGAELTVKLTGSVNEGAFGSVTFRSADETIATVTAEGRITGVTPGETEIIGETYVEGIQATCKVTVVPTPDRVTVQEAATLGVKETLQLEPEIPEGTMSGFAYTTSKKGVATVSADGVVTAKAVGTAVITVTTENGKKATCKVTVKKAPGSIKLNVSSGKLGVGETYQLQYTLTKNSWGTVTYKSNNEEVATVNAETGLVEAKSAGTATITATTHNGKKATCKVTVLNRPERIELSATELTVGAELTVKLTGSVNEGAFGSVTFRSADETIATVTAEGRITGVTPGETEIIGETYVEGIQATCKVTVVPTPDRVTVQEAATLGVKEKLQLEPEIPEGTMSGFAYTTSKKGVATVSADGVVTAKAVGTAVITVTTENGKKATCKVTVKKAPGSIKLNVSSGKLGVGETYQLQYTLTKNSWGTVAYKSNNEEVATVNAETGLVEAKAAGTATITATTHNGKKATCKVTVLNRPERIELSATELTVGAELTVKLTGSVNEGAFGSVTFRSADETIATVTAEGRITGVTPGETEIIGETYVEGIRATCKVTVVPTPDRVTVQEAATLGVKEKLQLEPEIPEGTMSGFAYTTSKKGVATVSADGVVTAKAVGTAVITVTTENGKKATCKVTVKKAPGSIKLNVSSGKLGVGETYQLKYTLTANTASAVTFTSSDESVVQVDAATGLVRAVGAGSATITAATFNGKKADCRVTVYPAPTRIALARDAFTLGVGETASLGAQADTGDYHGIFYTTSDAGVVTVSATGELQAVGQGVAEVTANTYVEGLSATARVTVLAAPTSVSLPETLRVLLGDTCQLTPVLPAGSAATLVYTSADSDVAEVSAGGVITARARGTTEIRVRTYNGKTATTRVEVYDPTYPTRLTLGDLPDVLSIGQTFAIPCTLEPETAHPDMIWKSLEPAIATVDASGTIRTLSWGRCTVIGVSAYNAELTVEYNFIVLSDEVVLTLPARRTGVDAIEANLARIRAIEDYAYQEIERAYVYGKMTKAEYVRRVSIIKKAFAMYAFPWMTKEVELYWKAENSDGGAKDYKPGTVYYGLPYTQTNRAYNVDKAVKGGYYSAVAGEDYYMLNSGKIADRKYVGSDCSSFASMAYWGTGSDYSYATTRTIATLSVYRTIPWSDGLRTGDMICKSNKHVVIFLYYANAAKTQIMVIEQGGGEFGINTVSCSVYKLSYYIDEGYEIRRLISY